MFTGDLASVAAYEILECEPPPSLKFVCRIFLKSYKRSLNRTGSILESMKSRLAIVVVIFGAIAAVWILVYRHSATDTIDYRGERIKLSRKYGDFSTYKNDPNNIDIMETRRVQRLVREAPIARSFASRIEFAQATGTIAFPGYGSGALRDTPQSDGSVLVLTSIEIPRAEEERYFTARVSDGRYTLIDDFVASESARLQFVEQVGDKLVYTTDYQGENKVVRPIHNNFNR
jgi:hypothetical protein